MKLEKKTYLQKHNNRRKLFHIGTWVGSCIVYCVVTGAVLNGVRVQQESNKANNLNNVTNYTNEYGLDIKDLYIVDDPVDGKFLITRKDDLFSNIGSITDDGAGTIKSVKADLAGHNEAKDKYLNCLLATVLAGFTMGAGKKILDFYDRKGPIDSFNLHGNKVYINNDNYNLHIKVRVEKLTDFRKNSEKEYYEAVFETSKILNPNQFENFKRQINLQNGKQFTEMTFKELREAFHQAEVLFISTNAPELVNNSRQLIEGNKAFNL